MLGSDTENWRWGGCNDDVKFGVDVSRQFADAHEYDTTARPSMNRYNNEAGRQVT